MLPRRVLETQPPSSLFTRHCQVHEKARFPVDWLRLSNDQSGKQWGFSLADKIIIARAIARLRCRIGLGPYTVASPPGLRNIFSAIAVSSRFFCALLPICFPIGISGKQASNLDALSL